MFKIFKKLKKNTELPSIYYELKAAENAEDYKLKFPNNNDYKGYDYGEYEYKILTGNIKVEQENTTELNLALDDYYLKKEDSLKKIDEFFKNHRALETMDGFQYHVFREDYFDENRLSGLATNLLRQARQVETVKFAILLSRYFDLSQKEALIELIYEYGTFPDFTYYSLLVLKPTDLYFAAMEYYKENTFSYGSKIVEKMEEKWN